MNGSVLLLLPMILPFIFGLIIGFQKEEKQRNILVFIAMAVEAALVWYLCSGEMQTFVLWGYLTDWHLFTKRTDWQDSLPASSVPSG